MPHFVSFARAGSGTLFALVLASACGGHSASNGADVNDAGRGGRSSHAGSSGIGGATGRAGSSSSGSPSSAGSPSSDACTGPSTLNSDGSGCAAYFRRWTHDSTTGLCTPVAYGGCGASKNNYETLEACQQACPGLSPGYDACKAPTDCVLAAPGCCGVCDGPDITKHDFIAYNKRYEANVATCAAGDVACGACPNPEGETTRKYFVPNCVNGECAVEDIRESDVTACTADEDCRLRDGTGCCEGCGGDVVSVRSDGSLEKLVCGDVLPPCLACGPSIPSDASASCGLTGRCEIVHTLK